MSVCVCVCILKKVDKKNSAYIIERKEEPETKREKEKHVNIYNL